MNEREKYFLNLCTIFAQAHTIPGEKSHGLAHKL